MRTRLLVIVISLVVVVVIGLGAPLAVSVASSDGQTLFLDRLTDTDRFASMAQHPLSVHDFNSLNQALIRYERVYGIRAAILDPSEKVQAHSTTRIDLTDPNVRDAMRQASAGRSAPGPSTLYPWRTAPMVVAEPVLLDGEQLGVAITVSSTQHARDQVLAWWGGLAGGAIVVIALAVLAIALPVVRWMLRPVHRLDQATSTISRAVAKGESVDPVGVGGGPPELRRLSRSFDQLAATVSDTLAAQRAFVADASHQLRNPLTALRLRLSSLSGHLTPEAEPLQVAAIADVDRLNRIVGELLAMAKAESGTDDPAEVDVDRVVTQWVATYQAQAEPRNVSLVLAGEPGGRARVQPKGLEKILDVLLENALKFTGDGTLVVVEVRRADGVVSVSVRDHGPGLKPDELAKATDRFWRSREHQNVPGTGLGLAIVKQYVDRVDGKVMLTTPEDGGGGLHVRIELPAVPTNV
ncbi:MAG TPA: HAMP domain-containing sensor histidine kinase [Pseudonocardiaceae bacterium]